MKHEKEVKELVSILLPLIDPTNLYFEEDRCGPFEDVRGVVRAALEEIDCEGLAGCRLCLS